MVWVQIILGTTFSRTSQPILLPAGLLRRGSATVPGWHDGDMGPSPGKH